jgi:hypothetical protein
MCLAKSSTSHRQVVYTLYVKASFLLFQARFFEVKQELETPQHGITDAAAVSQIDQGGPLQSDQVALERIYLVQIPFFRVILAGFAV